MRADVADICTALSLTWALCLFAVSRRHIADMCFTLYIFGGFFLNVILISEIFFLNPLVPDIDPIWHNES